MTNFSSISLKTKIIFQFILIGVLVFAIGYITFQGLQNTKSRFFEIQQIEQELRVIDILQSSRNRIEQSIQSLVYFGDVRSIELFEQEKDIALPPVTSNSFEKYADYKQQAENLIVVGEEIIKIYESGAYQAASDLLRSKFQPVSDVTLESLTVLHQNKVSLFKDLVEETRKQISQMVVIITLAVIIAAGMTALYSALMIFPAIITLRRLEADVSAYGAGTLESIKPFKGRDEIAGLSESFSEMANSLNKKTKDLEMLNDELNLRVEERTQEIEFERQVTENERQRLSAVLGSIGDGVLVVDKSGIITQVNAKAAEILQANSGEIVGTTTRSVDFDRWGLAEVFKLFFGNSAQEIELTKGTILMRSDGVAINVAGNVSDVRYHDKDLGAVLVFRDITKQVNLERIRDEFASVASHQMRTPLATIKWQVEILLGELRDTLNTQQLNFMYGIKSSNARMIRLVSDLLQASQIATTTAESLNSSCANVSDVISDIVSQLQKTAEEKKIEIVWDGKQPAAAYIDRQQMNEALLNIIHNAVKYSKSGSKVVILLGLDDDQMTISVSDQGIGIPENEHQHVFERFYRAGNAVSADAEGNGLGLYITQTIINLHGGTIRFESKQDEGTTFWITLPRGCSQFENKNDA